MPILLLALTAFPIFAHAMDWCALPAAHRAECRSPHSPLQAHPGNCPAPDEMRNCELSATKICQIEHYDNIGLGYERLNDKLNNAIAANSNSPYIEIEPFSNKGTIRIEKPIRLPAVSELTQVSQQHYAVCLIVETDR